MRILSWDLLAMIRSSDLFAAGAHVGNHGFDAILVDGAQGVVGHTQLDPAVFAGNPEATLMQVRQPAATGTVVGVRDVVAAHHTLAGDLTYTGHDDLRKNGLLKAVLPPVSQGDIGPATPVRHAMLENVATPGRLGPYCVTNCPENRVDMGRAAYSRRNTGRYAIFRHPQPALQGCAGRGCMEQSVSLLDRPRLKRNTRWHKKSPTTRPMARPVSRSW